MNSRSDDRSIEQSSTGFYRRSQPMVQLERDAVVRNVKIAKTVVGDTAALTGLLRE